jgi:Kef-type K+ transport system membrane component KefB
MHMSLQEAIRLLKLTHVEDLLLPVLVQLAVIVIAARAVGELFRRLKQSVVVGEIAAGLMLGPSLLGGLPLVHSVFHPQLPDVPPELCDQVYRWIFTILSQLGLILLLFLVGLEFDFGHLRIKGRSAFWISIVGIVLPFGLGLAIAPIVHANASIYAAGEAPPQFWVFALFIGTALSITALPILGRLMIELNIQRSRIGAVAITSAAAGDAVGWILLAAVSALAQSRFHWPALVKMFGLTIGFGLFMTIIARPLLCKVARSLAQQHEGISVNAMAVLIAVLFVCAMATSWIGIFAIFGAFLFGAVLSGEADFRHKIERQLHSFVTAFFLPIFFTYTGLRTRVQSLDSPELWLIFGLVLVAAIGGKFIGCAIAARATGFGPRESACIGVMMNTRALMELIVINVGYDLGVIPESVFCMLVLMALITTLMTTPLMLWLVRGTELEPLVAQSEFRLGRRRPMDLHG